MPVTASAVFNRPSQTSEQEQYEFVSMSSAAHHQLLGSKHQPHAEEYFHLGESSMQYS